MAENERPEGAQGERRNVYITLHRNFVREGIEYTDRRTGETRTFNQVTLPAGTVIDGRDVGGYEFSPLFVNPARFRDPEAWRDIPLLADREVRLSRSVLDEEGNPVLGADGRREKDVEDVARVGPEHADPADARDREQVAELPGHAGLRQRHDEADHRGRRCRVRAASDVARELGGKRHGPGPDRGDGRAAKRDEGACREQKRGAARGA